MKIVCDTNVLISAFFWGGNSLKIIESALVTNSKIQIFISHTIVSELQIVSERKKFKKEDILNLIQVITTNFELISDFSSSMPDICRDEKDNHLLCLSDTVQAEFLVTGDKDLLVLKKYKSSTILSPSEFVQKFI